MESTTQTNAAKTTSATFLQNLRSATDHQHKQLETAKLSISLMDEKASLQDYVNYLAAMEQVVMFTESTIFPIVKEIMTDLAERKKLASIQKDLAVLPANANSLNNKAFQPLEGNISLPFALGYMYVVEGSSLGGRVILKHLQPKIGVDENNGASYFAGYKEETGKYWKFFLSNFTSYVVLSNCEAEVIEGAKHAFNSIYEYFESV